MDDVSRALLHGIEAQVPAWVERSVRHVMLAWCGRVPPEVEAAAAAAGRRAGQETVSRARALLGADFASQSGTPLGLVRQAVRYPTQVLRDAGVAPVERDRYVLAAFPDDDYGITPASWADVHPSLAELGLAWGAAKAVTHAREGMSPGQPRAGEAG